MTIRMLLLLNHVYIRVAVLLQAFRDASQSCSVERRVYDGEVLVAIIVLQQGLGGDSVDESRCRLVSYPLYRACFDAIGEADPSYP